MKDRTERYCYHAFIVGYNIPEMIIYQLLNNGESK